MKPEIQSYSTTDNSIKQLPTKWKYVLHSFYAIRVFVANGDEHYRLGDNRRLGNTKYVRSPQGEKHSIANLFDAFSVGMFFGN